MTEQVSNLLQYSRDPAPRNIAGKLALGFVIATIPLAAGIFWADYDRRPPVFLATIACAMMAVLSGIWSARAKRKHRCRDAWIVIPIALLELVSVLAVGVASNALVQPRVESPRLACASNMRQILLATLMYANENKNGQLPSSLDVLLTTEDIDARVFLCPTANLTPAPGATAADQAASMRADPAHYLSYVYLGRGLTNDAKGPPQIILYEPLSDHGGDGINVGYSDGSVIWLDRKQAIPAINAAVSAAAARATMLESVPANKPGAQK